MRRGASARLGLPFRAPLTAAVLGRGRNQEVYSECPKLSADLTLAIVTGMQDNAPGEKVGKDGHILSAACCKHYGVYNVETLPTDRHHFNAVVNVRPSRSICWSGCLLANQETSEFQGRDLWETYLPVFEACVAVAKGAHVMCSYNAINGSTPARGRSELNAAGLDDRLLWCCV